METVYLYTYVSSRGLNPLTGEVYPEGRPKYRSIHEVYELLKLGFTVEQRDGGLRIPLNLGLFEKKFAQHLKTLAEENEKKANTNIRKK